MENLNYEEQVAKYGSFFFLRTIDEKLYGLVRDVEVAAMQSPDTMGDQARAALDYFLFEIALKNNNLKRKECLDFYNGTHPGNLGETELHIAIFCAYEAKQIPLNIYIYPEQIKGSEKKTKNMSFMDKFCDDWDTTKKSRFYRKKFANSPKNIVLFMQSFFYIISGYYQFYKKAPLDLPDYDYRISLGSVGQIEDVGDMPALEARKQ